MYSGEVEFFEVTFDGRLGRRSYSYSLFDYFSNLGVADSRRLADEVIDLIYNCESLDELEEVIYDNCSVRNYSWDLSDDTSEYTDFYGAAFSNRPSFIMRVYKE